MIALLVSFFFAAAPDSSALVSEQAKLTVRYDKGAVTILRVERQRLASPVRMPRWRGRFEARALNGSKTIDFVRFDFPLMAAAEAPDDTTEEAKVLGKRLREHVTATQIVRVPVPSGASAIAVWDSLTRKSVSAELPATATPAAADDGSTKR